ncbi:MAG: hypothetical protein MJZ38_04445 [archaeon]|nr:hypothetical protein [archaeon]
MADDGKDEIKFLSKEEMLRLLLIEDEEFKDEGRDVYMDEVIDLVRKDLGTDGSSEEEKKE